MPRLIALVVCLAAGFALFYVSARTPSPLAAGAPAGVFSAGRAMADIAAMASTPHPVGSAAHAKVRDYLVGRMTALGLSPQIQRDQGFRARAFKGETWASGANVENVIGVLPGRNPALPALALMAHYDSVPGSPGAADDAAGVAAILEIVRAIKAAGAPARDVMAVITDGEEAGLLGAQAFFADHPLAAHAGFVLNLEARGGGGRAAMFETGAMNGGAIDLFRATAARPSSTSLSVFVYKLLPNDTDFTIAKARGLAGLNYAFIGRQFDYHSPSSTVAALDQGSVQHLGDEVLGTAKALAFSAALPARAPDRVYADLLGAVVVAYPPWLGWPILILTAGLIAAGAWRARREGAFFWLDALKGFGAALLVIMGAAMAFHITRHVTGTGFGFTEQRPLLARFALFEVAMAASGLGALLLVAGFVGGGKARLAGTWTGLLASALIAGLALQVAAPTIAFVVAWPLLAAGAVSALSAAGEVPRRAGLGLALALIAFTLAWLGGFFHTLLQGLDVPEAPALALWLAAMVLWPLAWPAPGAGARRFVPGGVALAAGLGIALGMRATSPWSPRHPQAAEPLMIVEPASGKAWRASPIALDPWSRAVLTADGGAISRRAFPGFVGKIDAAPARPVTVIAPAVTVAHGPYGTVVVNAPTARGVLALRLDLRADTLVGAVTVNGRRAPILGRPGRWTHLFWKAAPQGLTVSFRPVGPGTLQIGYAQFLDTWPAEAKALPPMPRAVMAWDLAGSAVVVGERRERW